MLCWRRQRRSSQTAASELPSHQTDADIKPDPSGTIWIPELGQEGAVSRPHELPATYTPLPEPLGCSEATETPLRDITGLDIAEPD